MSIPLAVLCSLLLPSGHVVAQEPPPPIPTEFFKGRRAALAEAVKEQTPEGRTSVVLVRGAPSPAHMGVFRQSHEFYYLSGVVQADLSLLLFPSSGEEVLLVPPFNRFTATWDGERLAPGEAAAEATGFLEVGNVRSLRERLDAALAPDADGRRPILWTILRPSPVGTATSNSAAKGASVVQTDPLDGRESREARLRQRMQEFYPGLEVQDLTPLVDRLRVVKTDVEIAAITAATRCAVAGIGEAMRSVQPGVYEFQLAAAARYVFSRMGAGADAYAAIVGAGRNGCVLHYSSNHSRIEKDDLIVMDYAPSVHGYCADVTRTFPASGKFTPEQRKLVQDVHDVQQVILAAVRPGARLSQLDSISRRELRARGYRVDHGPCHHVGLAVHDSSVDILRPGMVITVEPGAYLRDKGYGCRIEDMILITADGYVNLSGDLPSSPDAIEAFMQATGILQIPLGEPR